MGNRLVGDVAKMTVAMSLFNQPVQISHYFRMVSATAGGTDDVQGLLDKYNNVPLGLLRLCMSPDVTVVAEHVQDIINSAATALERRTVIQNVGAVGDRTGAAPGAADVSQTCGVITWQTGFSGAGERGRSFIPGLSHTDIVAGVLSYGAGSIQEAYQNYANSLIAAFDGTVGAGAGWQFVLWRQHLTGVGAFEGMVPDPETHVYLHPPRTRRPFNPLAADHNITAGVVRDRVRTQRRRGIGVRIGRHR